ncbi:MAG: mRNA surveillance protein pelota [Thermoplasmata archaeon]|nr:mRNA surveillance protein pelota [Thermoplasmata archaeon]
MKILHKDLKKGEIVVKVQSYEDCWHLYNIIEKGDFISGYTYRSREERGNKIRSKKEEKERVYLKIKVTDKEFQKFTDRLRIRGIIVEGIEEKAYHTFNIEPNIEIKIEKKWDDISLSRIKRATKIEPKIVVVAIDDESATIAIIHEYGIQEIATIYSPHSGKMYDEKEQDKKSFYGQILSKILEIDMPLVIIGPGFEKDKFIEFAKDKLKKYIVEPTAHAGMTGINEAIKKGIVEEIYKENRVTKEIKIMERVMEEIAKDGLIAYGREEVIKAIENGAVEKLIILNSMVRGNEEIIKKAEKIKADVVVISEWHEGGEKLAALGGLAALLRYKIS